MGKDIFKYKIGDKIYYCLMKRHGYCNIEKITSFVTLTENNFVNHFRGKRLNQYVTIFGQKCLIWIFNKDFSSTYRLDDSTTLFIANSENVLKSRVNNCLSKIY